MRATLLAAAILAIPSMGLAEAPAALDEFASTKVIRVLTLDEDGDARDTKIWVAVVDGNAYIRTSDTRWFKNLERGSSLSLVMNEKTYSAAITRIEDAARIEAVHAEFRKKYGFQDRMVGLFGGGDYVLRLDRSP